MTLLLATKNGLHFMTRAFLRKPELKKAIKRRPMLGVDKIRFHRLDGIPRFKCNTTIECGVVPFPCG